jgi:hypothetical protein
MRKWIAIAALLLCAAMLFSACAKWDEQQPEDVVDDAGIVDEDVATPSIDGPVYEGNDIASSPFVGEFKNTYSALFASKVEDVFENEGDIPVLVCEADGNFAFYVNDLISEGLLTVEGTFTVDGDIATFTIAGESAAVFTMELINKDEMRYSGDELYCVSRGDIFERM